VLLQMCVCVHMCVCVCEWECMCACVRESVCVSRCIGGQVIFWKSLCKRV